MDNADYVKKAQECVDAAEKIADPGERAALLKVASCHLPLAHYVAARQDHGTAHRQQDQQDHLPDSHGTELRLTPRPQIRMRDLFSVAPCLPGRPLDRRMLGIRVPRSSIATKTTLLSFARRVLLTWIPCRASSHGGIDPFGGAGSNG